MPCKLFLVALLLVIATLSGCGGQETSKESESSGSPPPTTPESAGGVVHDVEIDTQGSVMGNMTIIVAGKEMSFELKHIVAYRFEFQLAGPPTRVSTLVLLTPDTINTEDVQTQLDQNQDDFMEARPLFPEGPYLMMEIGKNGDLRQVSGNALGHDSTTVGAAISTKGIEQDFAIEGGRLQGEVRLAKGKDEVLFFDCQIDVLHFAQ